jgi:glycosyltransferase involved in cell wall biosynthesis
MLFTAITPYPLLVIRNFSFQERREIKKELSRGVYDIIHAETFYVMPHIPKTKIPSIMVEQTIEYQVYKHYVDNEVPLILRPIFMIDVIKLRFWELYFWKKTNRLVAVSNDDRDIMKRLVPGIKVDVIPNGVDSDYYLSKKVEKKMPPRLLYGVTNFEWLQNVEAVNILIDQVWPKVHSRVPEAKLWIVGRLIPQRILDLARHRRDIEVTESIKDARDAYGAASLMVTPIRGSGGTRLKILEAMAAGLPIVSTSVGVAGLGLIPGKHALVSDSIDELSEHAVRLLLDQSLSKKIGLAGQKFVRDNFDWKKIVKLHDRIYTEAIKVKK